MFSYTLCCSLTLDSISSPKLSPSKLSTFTLNFIHSDLTSIYWKPARGPVLQGGFPYMSFSQQLSEAGNIISISQLGILKLWSWKAYVFLTVWDIDLDLPDSTDQSVFTSLSLSTSPSEQPPATSPSSSTLPRAWASLSRSVPPKSPTTSSTTSCQWPHDHWQLGNSLIGN